MWPASRVIRDRPIRSYESATELTGIVTLGTSLTANYSWPEQFRTSLEACLGHPIKLTRIARPGATSEWGLEQVARITAAAPDLVIIEFSINDGDLKDGLWAGRSEAVHRKLVGQLSAALPDARILLLTMSPVYGARRLTRPTIASYYDIYPKIAAELDIGVLDLFPRWVSQGYGRADFRDGVHPTDAAASAVVVRPLVAAVGAAAGHACAPAG